MTRLGAGAFITGLVVLAIGLAARWQPVAALGGGMVVLVGGSTVYVLRRPRIELERAVEPPRVEKGQPAISVVHVLNLSRRTLAPISMVQRIGDRPVAADLPRLRGGERGLRTYRLPTTHRGLFEVGPVEVARADPFGLCRTVQHFGETQTIAVHPRLVALRPLSTGTRRNLEGPSSDTSPQGTVTFHRLREYAVGDDLRMVHWPSTARAGRLVVKQHVDTAQPYSVVLLDLDPARYSAETFEEAVDVAASAVVSLSTGKAPVQLRTTAGERIGGSAWRDPVGAVDFLTTVAPSDSGTLEGDLVLLRRERGGTALIVVTGRLEPASASRVGSLRRRFDRVIVVSVDDRPLPSAAPPGVIVVSGPTAAEVVKGWNTTVAR